MDSSSYLMSDYKKIQTIFIFGVWNLLLKRILSSYKLLFIQKFQKISLIAEDIIQEHK